MSAFPALLAPPSAPGQYCDAWRSPNGLRCGSTCLVRVEPVYIATQRWMLDPWVDEDPPGLSKIWARKPKFAVNGSRSCAELAIVHYMRTRAGTGSG